MTEPRVDGREAYRDDPEYTSPEMEPGHGEDIPPETDPALGVASTAALGMGVGGAAFAGEILGQEIEEEEGERRPRPDPDE